MNLCDSFIERLTKGNGKVLHRGSKRANPVVPGICLKMTMYQEQIEEPAVKSCSRLNQACKKSPDPSDNVRHYQKMKVFLSFARSNQGLQILFVCAKKSLSVQSEPS